MDLVLIHDIFVWRERFVGKITGRAPIPLSLTVQGHKGEISSKCHNIIDTWSGSSNIIVHEPYNTVLWLSNKAISEIENFFD